MGEILGEWLPEEVLSEYDLQAIHNQDYLKLKEEVSTYLTGSWCSKEKTALLMDLVLVTRPLQCVEVGAWTGSSILPVAATLQYLHRGTLTAIDAWSNAEAIRYLDTSDPNRDWWSKVDMGIAKKQFENMLQSWGLKSRCRVISKASNKAVFGLNDNIDILHLDGGFSEETSYNDALLYLNKVRSGGYILFSNVFHTVHGTYPKKKAFSALFESCDVICTIDGENTVLFQKR
jgi:predicted O-methyltransferase YrrM